MLPSTSIGQAVDSTKTIDTQDISSLIPRPGWQEALGIFIIDI